MPLAYLLLAFILTTVLATRTKIVKMGNGTSVHDFSPAAHKYDDEGKQNIKDAPNRTARGTFDPLLGFQNGRKERVMVATLKEMEDAQVPLDKRDYCAHLYIKWKKCHHDNRPWAKPYCKHEAHEYAHCQHEDFILRKKEYERERRLQERQKKQLLVQLQNAEAEIQ